MQACPFKSCSAPVICSLFHGLLMGHFLKATHVWRFVWGHSMCLPDFVCKLVPVKSCSAPVLCNLLLELLWGMSLMLPIFGALSGGHSMCRPSSYCRLSEVLVVCDIPPRSAVHHQPGCSLPSVAEPCSSVLLKAWPVFWAGVAGKTGNA